MPAVDEPGVSEADYPEIRVERSGSEIRQLYGPLELERYASELRALLAMDDSPDTERALQTSFGRELAGLGGWFQRIHFPMHGITTTSDPARWDSVDPGPLNTLWRRLSASEGNRLRPYPKWAYLRDVLPDVRGKTVLEIGSSCGFFSLRFAELGAEAVTGIEIIPAQHAQAAWAARQLGLDGRVTFRNVDGFLNPDVQPHDVVFMSEVYVHSILPAFSLLRCINLAKEFVVIDDFFGRNDEQPAQLHIFRDMHWARGKITWTAFALTEKLLFELLYVFGVEPHRVIRYHGINDHTVLVIDTRGVQEFRQEHIAHPSLRSFLELNTRG